ncbi:putative poly RNA polymerase cid13 [Rosellinia necatrix]|uniref:polynucleotide adenylyltransferase n=1 Tax=Rosellinia necatrix TaxID=77044 RepID=A0A1W2TTR6_ROSNE|nr:putative poly RNA polymerase cid13 [Rosellinia necatrix]
MESVQGGNGSLEGRLRNLILTNPSTAALLDERSSNTAVSMSASPSQHAPQAKEELGDGQASSHTIRSQPKGGKKRPNQAQRRQMNAEFSIPFDTRESVGTHSQHNSRPHPRGGPRAPQNGRQHGQQHGQQHSQQYSQQHGQQHGQQQNPFPSHASAYPANPQDQAAFGSSRGRWFPGQLGRAHVISPDAFASRNSRQPAQHQPAPYSPGSSWQAGIGSEQLASQSAFLDQLCSQIVTDAEIGPQEIAEKESFRRHVQAICQHVVARHEYEVYGGREFQPETMELKCFGSLASGFATKAADMDLGLLSPMSRLSPDSPESPIPRLIEGALLAAGFGARLLTRTRVPILKLCEKPDMALQQGLLDARKKWESGLDQEEQEPDDDVPEDLDLPPDTNSPLNADRKQVLTKPITSQSSLGGQEISSASEGLFSLKQSPNQSLAGYYGNAKRLLRQLNGRDISHSNSHDFTVPDFILLDKVACAFVQGLHDDDLRSRIMRYPSFHIGDATKQTNYRTLFGVNTMIEGEKLLMLWETTQLFPDHSKTDPKTENAMRQWKHLQHNRNFGDQPLWFNKDLQLCVESLRQIPSMQISQLRQDQHESPRGYHNRTAKIVSRLSVPSSSDINLVPYIVQNYVNGIRDKDIRNKIQEFVSWTGTQNLATVARIHKALHLAADYERAVEHRQYHPDALPVIQSYIALLRRKPIRSTLRPVEYEYLVPVAQYEGTVLDSIKSLPDPAALRPNKPRNRYNDSLEFPKSGVGVQCDVNFSAHLALQNTLLLRCYSHTDPRVRPLVLFVKHWAKARGINTPYRGTLSSYGYVLMVLHYLINIVEPFVCPNLQQLAPPDPDLPPYALEGVTTCQGRNVRFWRDEQAIQSLAQQGLLNQNHDSLGTLLQGFFDYYAQGHMMTTVQKKAFDWGRDVISLRTHGGILSKVEKGWTGAKTVVQPRGGTAPTAAELDLTATQSPPPNGSMAAQAKTGQLGTRQEIPKSREVKEIRHRYLFAIEDPFELDHNVARTVMHDGIVSIRNEFRRAWRIIKNAGKGTVSENLMEDVKAHEEEVERVQFSALIDDIHGDELFVDINPT